MSHASHHPDTAATHDGGPLAGWDRFIREHDDWRRRRPPGEPFYCLPEAAIDRLAIPRRSRPPLLDKQAALAERRLLGLCLEARAVGFWSGRPVIYAPLTPPWPMPSGERMKASGFTPEQCDAVRASAARLETVNLRLKGYAGWLNTEEPFLAASKGLAARWAELPEDLRPGFPLRRAGPLIDATGLLMPAPQPAADFAADFDALCDRWGLIGMAAWDLPEPQGPLMPALLAPGGPALPRHGVLLSLPIHYPLTGDDAELLDMIRRQQRLAAADAGLDPSLAGLPHYKAYARILDVAHWERIILARYGPPARAPGIVTLAEMAIMDALGDIGLDQVQKLRKFISACRRGRRADLAALRVRA